LLASHTGGCAGPIPFVLRGCEAYCIHFCLFARGGAPAKILRRKWEEQTMVRRVNFQTLAWVLCLPSPSHCWYLGHPLTSGRTYVCRIKLARCVKYHSRWYHVIKNLACSS
jgi:hypothetical protein